jgi:hypothetical protein
MKKKGSNCCGADIKTIWLTDHWSQYNLNLRDCTANYRPVLSSERVPYMKKKGSYCHSKKCNIWSSVPKGGLTSRQTGRLTVGHNIT